jgi:phage terminase large subunit
LAKRDKKQSIRESIAAISPRVEPDDRELNKGLLPELKGSGVVAASTPLREDAPRRGRGIKFPQDEMISLPSTLPNLRTLQKELSQPTAVKDTRMRLKIDKQPEGTRSRNLADAVVMCYWPVGDSVYDSMDWV